RSGWRWREMSGCLGPAALLFEGSKNLRHPIALRAIPKGRPDAERRFCTPPARKLAGLVEDLVQVQRIRPAPGPPEGTAERRRPPGAPPRAGFVAGPRFAVPTRGLPGRRKGPRRFTRVNSRAKWPWTGEIYLPRWLTDWLRLRFLAGFLHGLVKHGLRAGKMAGLRCLLASDFQDRSTCDEPATLVTCTAGVSGPRVLS
ncbi:MAG: hypothetical protein ACJAZN_003531, partial [Planctomycetota bacterium]